MELENTSIRLKKIMQERNLRQVDLLEMLKPLCEKYNVKINKSDISQYISGKVKPGQEKLSMLGMALKLNEAWLMGYDVPKEKIHYTKELNLSKEETTLLENYNKSNEDGKKMIVNYSDYVSQNYTDTSSEISATKDNVINITNRNTEEYTLAAHDDDLDEETKQKTISKVKNIFKQMDEE